MPRFAFHRLFPPVLLAAAALAQPVTKPMKFEVAAIKPADPDARGSSIMTDKAGGLNATNMPIRALITMAYGIRDFQLSGGPGWLSSDRYDVMAKPEPVAAASEPPDPRSMTEDQRKVRDEQWKERVQSLLADRFGLVIHKEMKEGQIYLLTVAKGGPKMTEVKTPGNRQGMSMNRGRAQGYAAPMQMLANNLSGTVGRLVIDKTGLTGKYDWTLEWTPDAALAVPGPDAPPPSVAAGPSIFTAVQDQLGLKLEASKGPIETWVIDRIDRPSGN